MNLFKKMCSKILARTTPGHLHKDIRTAVIQQHAIQVPHGGIAIFGDSIVEMALLESSDARSILNAGMGSSTVSGVLEIIDPILESARPSVVVLSVGVNDAQFSKNSDLETWSRQYEDLIGRIKTAQVSIMGIDPVEPGMPVGDTYFNQPFIELQNVELAKLADTHGRAFVSPSKTSAGMTNDGVHLNLEGYRRYLDRIKQAIAAAK